MLAVLGERVWEVGCAYASWLLGHGVLLLKHVLLLADLSEPGVLEGLWCRYAIVGVVDEQLLDEVDDFGTSLGDEFGDAGALNSPHTKLCKVHMAGMALELVEECLFRRAEYVMYLVHLVELVVAGEQWEKGDDFEHDTTDTP